MGRGAMGAGRSTPAGALGSGDGSGRGSERGRHHNASTSRTAPATDTAIAPRILTTEPRRRGDPRGGIVADRVRDVERALEPQRETVGSRADQTGLRHEVLIARAAVEDGVDELTVDWV